jgi:NAD(P)-dependent dehydrogenase (short-subunit alcohol dehydrogenase family)
MKVVQNRTAFIAGGASGIGLGIAGAFVDAIRLDVTDRAALAVAAEETERVFGKLHVLVNNAGVGIQGPFKGITYADWDFGLAVNLV